MTPAARKVKLKDGAVIERPTVRRVESSHGPLVAELLNRTLTLRPPRSPITSPAAITVTFGAIYQHEMERRALEELRARQRGRRGARRLPR